MSSQPLRRSRRLASIISASYWISIGYSENDAQAIEKLQNDMKKYCDGGGDQTDIKLGGGYYIDDSMINIPNRYILPHWNKLAKALIGRTSMENVDLYGISIPISVLDIILPAFQSMNLNRLYLCNVGLDSDGLLRLSSFLEDNTSLKVLYLGGDTIDDISIASSLSYAIKSHPSLNTLVFSACGCSNNTVLEKILEGCAKLRILSISFETLGLDATVIADFIRSNHSIQGIILDHDKISDDDTLLFASALKMNTQLRQLDLSDNKITEEGENVLLNALFDQTSMDSIVESNHTCVPYTFDVSKPSIVAQRPPLEQELLTINTNNFISIKQKIRRKVVLALCGVDGGLFDLSHLNDLPLKLMPRVLELIQEFTASRGKQLIRIHTATRTDLIGKQTEKDALSRLFHTLRGWELPLLFENLKPKKGLAAGKRKRKTRR